MIKNINFPIPQLNNITMKLLSFLFLFLPFLVTAQPYVLENSHIRFYSHTPVEDIDAITKDTKGVIDFTKNSFTFRVPITSFSFRLALMQSHFNENYLESSKFPNASFKGDLKGNYDLTKDGEYEVTSTGDLDVHGVVQKRTIPAKIIVKNGKVSLFAKFMIKLADHNIKIPSVVFQNIAEEVEVTVESDLKKYEKQ
jgi:polyisoprenoid-binding protein YceI